MKHFPVLLPTVLLLLSCNPTEDPSPISVGEVQSCSSMCFSATISAQFTSVTIKELSDAEYGILLCENSEKPDQAIESWKNGDDTPNNCLVLRNIKAGSLKITQDIDNLKPGTEYVCCIYFKSNDGTKRLVGDSYLFNTKSFEPETTELYAWGELTEIGVEGILSNLSQSDMAHCTVSLVCTNVSNMEDRIVAEGRMKKDGNFQILSQGLKMGSPYKISVFVKESATEKCVNLTELNVETKTYDDYKADFGLSVLWGKITLGASNMQDIGDYYQWGELIKDESKGLLSDYQYYDSSSDSYTLLNDICGTDHDIAHKTMKGKWRLPSYEDVLDLVNAIKQGTISGYDLYSVNTSLIWKSNKSAFLYNKNNFNEYMYAPYYYAYFDGVAYKEAGNFCIPTGTPVPGKPGKFYVGEIRQKSIYQYEAWVSEYACSASFTIRPVWDPYMKE